MKFAAAFAAALVASASAYGDIWSSCASPNAHLTDLKVDINPDPPVKGKPISIAATGTLDEDVTGGAIQVEVEYLGIKILNESLDLCKTIAKYQPCPIKAGPLDAKISQNLPSDAPSGHYTGKATITDQNKGQITCINLDFTLN